jgi:hypothetical protein
MSTFRSFLSHPHNRPIASAPIQRCCRSMRPPRFEPEAARPRRVGKCMPLVKQGMCRKRRVGLSLAQASCRSQRRRDIDGVTAKFARPERLAAPCAFASLGHRATTSEGKLHHPKRGIIRAATAPLATPGDRNLNRKSGRAEGFGCWFVASKCPLREFWNQKKLPDLPPSCENSGRPSSVATWQHRSRGLPAIG